MKTAKTAERQIRGNLLDAVTERMTEDFVSLLNKSDIPRSKVSDNQLEEAEFIWSAYQVGNPQMLAIECLQFCLASLFAVEGLGLSRDRLAPIEDSELFAATQLLLMPQRPQRRLATMLAAMVLQKASLSLALVMSSQRLAIPLNGEVLGQMGLTLADVATLLKKDALFIRDNLSTIPLYEVVGRIAEG